MINNGVNYFNKKKIKRNILIFTNNKFIIMKYLYVSRLIF